MATDLLRRTTDARPCVAELRLDTTTCHATCRSIVTAAIEAGSFARSSSTRSRGAVVGRFPSFKMDAAFPIESNIEASVLPFVDVLERVRAYRPQALRVVFPFENGTAVAYPDIPVLLLGGEVEIWECKPNGALAARAFKRMRALHAALRGVGIRYVVRQPGWARRAPQATNASLVWRHADGALPGGASAEAHEAVRSGISTLGELRRCLDMTLPALLGLAARGAFAVDIGRAPLGDASFIREAASGATSGAFDATVDDGVA